MKTEEQVRVFLHSVFEDYTNELNKNPKDELRLKELGGIIKTLLWVLEK